MRRPDQVAEHEADPDFESHGSLLTWIQSLMKSNDTTQKNNSPAKSPSESAVTMTELVLPSDTNALGTIFGGKIMSWIDIAASIAAGKHARRIVVTASIDALSFLAPVKLGHIVHIKAMVNFSGRTSMEVGVRVDSEDPLSGVITHTSTAYTTFVALDDKGRPVNVPPLLPATPDEKRRFSDAQKRRQARIQLTEALKQ
jgi:acyl-CoA hydrolase